MSPDFARIEKFANELLLCQPIFSSKVNVRSLDCGQQIRYDTMQNYCKLTNCLMSELTINGKARDGLFIVKEDEVLILYNADVVAGRINWTLAHELGHFVFGHTSHGDIQELEANMFAGNLLAPAVVIHELMSRGIKINKSYLYNHFGLSFKGANSRIGTIERRMSTNYGCRKIADDPLQKMVLDNFAPYVDLLASPDLVFGRWGKLSQK